MTKLCFAILLFLIVLAVASYLPTIHSLQWVLRVGFPEVGWTFVVLGAAPAFGLARTHPRAAGLLFTFLLTLALTPWLQALGTARELQAAWGSPFLERVDRHPLFLGSREGHRKVTEEYKPGLQWDRYIPEQEARARLLFVHGGSWRNGTRDEFPQMFRYLADRGYEVICPTYTLSGKAPYPAPSVDLSAALERAHDDAVPLFVAGRSSGGHLGLLAAYRQPELVRGVIDFYAPVDMVWSYEHPSNPAVLNSNEAIVQFLGATPEQDPKLYQETSPLSQVTSLGPPTLLIHGLSDCLVYPRQSEMLQERLKAQGVDRFLLTLPWMEHGGDVFIYGPSGRLSLWAIESFIESLLAR